VKDVQKRLSTELDPWWKRQWYGVQCESAGKFQSVEIFDRSAPALCDENENWMSSQKVKPHPRSFEASQTLIQKIDLRFDTHTG
jgi:hypothetical protein